MQTLEFSIMDTPYTIDTYSTFTLDSENSEENISENIRANEYTFTDTGARFG